MENRHVVIILIEIDEVKEGSYLGTWQDAAEVMAAQPGFIRTYIVPHDRSGEHILSRQPG